MGTFTEAFNKIGGAIKDVSTLDVVTFKGSIKAKLTGDTMPEDFKAVLNLAGASDVDLKLVASTQMMIDGDILDYSDNDISDVERSAHNELVTLGQANREATMEFVRRVILDKLG